MLSKLEFHGTIPATDLERAKKFYSEKFGLEPDEEILVDLFTGVKTHGFSSILPSSQGQPSIL
jgi:predicted enzyme related to lactoylglutathione lyase